MRRVFLYTAGVAIMAVATIALLATSASAGSTRQTADLIENQSGGGEISADDAQLSRSPNGLSIKVTMETPAPGSYNYPDTVPVNRQVGPEVFTGWAFVFAEPGECKNADNSGPGPCDGDDFGDPDVGAGVYNFSGHAQDGGGSLVMSGHIRVGQTQLLRAPGGVAYPLSNPEGAEVHVAIAPHGQLDPSTLPDDLVSPVGSPTCDCWWVAAFYPLA